MKLLVIDDSKMMRYILTKMLNEIGYNLVLEAENVEMALKTIRSEKPDLIFSDWVMPDSTGLDLLKKVRNNPDTRDTPFVMVTTQKDQKHIIEASKAGLQCYLLKPIKKDILIQKITTLAKAYGFEPPNVKASVTTDNSPPDNEISEVENRLKNLLQGTIGEKDILKIIEHLHTQIDDEFTDKIAKEFFSSFNEEKKEEIQYFIDSIKNSVSEGITSYMEQFL